MNVLVFSGKKIQILVSNVSAPESVSFFSLTFNELLTFIVACFGIWIAISQFRKQMKENREAAKQTQKENWYLSVIVLPQIESINHFYKSIIDNCIEDLNGITFNRLTRVGVTALSQNDLEWIANKQERYKENINSFFDHIIFMIKSYSPDLAISLSDLIMQLEDASIGILNPLTGRNTNEEIRRLILKNKQQFITALYASLA